MNNKFTEEQYQEIINIWNNGQDFDDTILSVSDYARKLNARLNYEYGDNVYDYGEAILLALPKSREWAHEQFVEKEKKYVWTLKKVDKSGIKMRLCKEYFGKVQPFFSVTNVNIDDSEKLTESEIREWGYNPEMFDKEEVKD